MMKRLAALILTVFVSFSAHAQSAQLASASSVEELLRVTKAEELYKATMDKSARMMDKMLDDLIRREKIPPEQLISLNALREKYAELIDQEMSWEKMKPIYVAVYSETYTQQEIDDLLVFYRTPTGQALIDKQPIVLEKSMMAAQARMTPVMTQFFDEIKRQIAEGGKPSGKPAKKK